MKSKIQQPRSNPNLIKIGLTLTITTFIIVFALNSCGNSSSSNNSIKVSASTLWSDYKNDRDYARKKYDNELVEVSGKITNWMNGQPYFVFEENDNGIHTSDKSGVRCFMGGIEAMNRARAKKAAKNGDWVKLRGTCKGWDGDDVIVKDCRYVD